MKIVADENISHVKHYFGRDAQIVLKPGREIMQHDLIDADMLLVRSVTKVNQTLLQNTAVKFVGSATIGADHLDIEWLNHAGIRWSLAKGSNARAVVEYVICVLAALQKMNFLTGKKLRAAVIGVGEIGKQVVSVLEFLGFEVVLCDPFRADLKTVSLAEITNVDLVTLHTPLTRTGEYPTYHLLQADFFTRQKNNCVLLNTSRGEVVSFADLKLLGQSLIWCLDVWENEPVIDFEVLESALIATPHIAGYSVQSKQRGIEMLYQAVKHMFATEQAALIYPQKEISFAGATVGWRDVVLQVFDPLALAGEMKQRLLEDPNQFDQMRKEFNARYEFEFVKICDAVMRDDDQRILEFFGLSVVN